MIVDMKIKRSVHGIHGNLFDVIKTSFRVLVGREKWRSYILHSASLFPFFIFDHEKGKKQRVGALTIQMHYVQPSKIDPLPFLTYYKKKRIKEKE